MADTQTHTRTCHLCEANCGILIEHNGPEILSIKGDPNNALSRGHICPKAIALQDLQNDPDRLRMPQKRSGDEWEEISWEQAFSEIGTKVRGLLERHPNCFATYSGNPNVHSYGNALNARFIIKSLGQAQLYSASTVDQYPHQVAGYRMLGHFSLWGIPDIDRSEAVIIIGGNPVASNGSLWTVPDFRNRVKELQTRGGELITIDPRQTETAKIANHHHFIRPATDVFFLIALLKEISKGSTGKDIHPLAHGLNTVFETIQSFDTERCAKACAVPLETITSLAQTMIKKRAALYGRMGISIQQNGTLNAWLINLINIASSNFDREGGIVFNMPAVNNIASPSRKIGTKTSRVSGHRDVFGEFPAAALAEEITTPGDGQIRGMITIAGNPTLSTPNGQKLAEAMQELDLLVSIDMYRNATTRLAHYILPPVGPLEKDHYNFILLPSAVRNYANYSPAMLEADGYQDWEIFRMLAEAITGEAITAMPPEAMLARMIESGPYDITLDDLKANPSGIDFGPCKEGTLKDRIQTSDGMIDCAPAEFIEELKALKWPEERQETGLYLIGRRHVRTNNSWLGNSRRLVKGPNRCTLLIHSNDAQARQIQNGQFATVRVDNRSLTVEVEVSDEMMPGTVSLPHGWGHNLPGVKMGVATAHAGLSVNDLTDSSKIDPLSGNAALSGVVVEVSPALEAAE